MRHNLLSIVLAVTLVALLLLACQQVPSAKDSSKTTTQAITSQQKAKPSPQNTPTYQPPQVAGAFYPDDPNTLTTLVRNLLKSAHPPKVKGKIWGIIVPHAGYRYSGPVAASGFKAIKGKNYSRVVIIAFAHRGSPNVAVATRLVDYFLIPGRKIPVDKEAVSKLIRASGGLIQDAPEVFDKEHSLEVELPFLAEALGEDFKIVPIMLGQQTPDIARKLSKLIAERFAGKDGVLIVGSTDMSHYFDYSTAQKMDELAVETIKHGAPERLWELMQQRKIEFCGIAVVDTMMRINALIGGNEPVVLDMRNSGDTTGGTGRVVGYSAIAFTLPNKNKEGAKMKHEHGEYVITDEEKIALLKYARAVVEAAVRGEPAPDSSSLPDKFKQKGAAFVTLKKHGDLRGCIGHVIAHVPLDECIRDVGKAAALEDPRFPPVKPSELDDIEIEVSVLTPLKRLDDVSKVEVGRHGLVMKQGFRQGLLLPQVPVEWGWDRETFLQQTCHKAGLPANCYKDPRTEIYTFEAIVFSEGEFGLFPRK